ncbi:MAG: hypothetical protein JW915_18575, partial [Chitinispirillaceae bacterium]|nr:hypothetical protein [Chitinispirillaceae bacterium]
CRRRMGERENWEICNATKIFTFDPSAVYSVEEQSLFERLLRVIYDFILKPCTNSTIIMSPVATLYLSEPRKARHLVAPDGSKASTTGASLT